MFKNFTSKTDRDGEEAFVRRPYLDGDDPTDTVAIVGGAKTGRPYDTHEAFLDREDAVAAIAALTELVEAHDARKAAEAERKAREACLAQREAAKLKRGDIVHLKSDPSARRTVITDETAGRVDVVNLEGDGFTIAGEIQTRRRAAQYTREQTPRVTITSAHF